MLGNRAEYSPWDPLRPLCAAGPVPPRLGIAAAAARQTVGQGEAGDVYVGWGRVHACAHAWGKKQRCHLTA